MRLRPGLPLALLLALGCADEPPSIVVVTLDTVRCDHVGAYGDERHLTPHLDALAARGLVFEHAFTTNFHIRAEYLYAGLDEQRYKLSCFCTADLDMEEVHMMRAGFTYNFSGFFGFGGGTY